jgi:U-box domain
MCSSAPAADPPHAAAADAGVQLAASGQSAVTTAQLGAAGFGSDQGSGGPACSSAPAADPPHAAAADAGGQPAASTAQLISATDSGSDQGGGGPACSSVPAADAPRPEACAAPRTTAASGDGGPDAAVPPLQHAAVDVADAAAAQDWWRCPLSGGVMRDPVLYGSGGHSFERAALEQWLAANPGVDTLSRQLLPLGGDDLLPNHALRSLLQQLHLG